MPGLPVNFSTLSAASREIARRLLEIGENRVDLLMVEIHEERERAVHAIVLATSAAMLGLLAGIVGSAAIVIGFWSYSPLGVLIALTSVYSLGAWGLYSKLTLLRQKSEILPATLDQLRKDRKCLDEHLN